MPAGHARRAAAAVIGRNVWVPCAVVSYNRSYQATPCVGCQPGTYSPAGAVQCTLCELGRYDHDQVRGST
jgi:hypothetical protein